METGKTAPERFGVYVPNPKLRLLDQVREVVRLKHYSMRTEDAYVQWIKRFIFFHGKRHPLEMGAAEVEMFLTDLAVRCRVAASTQNQALNALVFLYKQVLHLELGEFEAVRARQPTRLPVVLSSTSRLRIVVRGRQFCASSDRSRIRRTINRL